MTFLFLVGKQEWEPPHPDQAPGTAWRTEGMYSLWQGLRRVTSKNLGTWATVSWTRLVSIISDFCHWWVRIIAYVTEDHEWELSLFEDEEWEIPEVSTFIAMERGADRQVFYKQMQIWDKALCFCFLLTVFFPNGQEPFALPYLWTVSSVMLDGMWTWVGKGVPWGFGNTISGCA